MKQALEYRKKFYNFHRELEGYSSTVNQFASDLRKQLTIKVKKLLDHHALANHFEQQLYKLAKNPRQTRKNWSEEETIFLISVVAYYSYLNNADYNNLDEAAWKFIAEIYPGKKPDQLRMRWHNVFKVTLTKAPWTPAEDDALAQIIKERGALHWKEIAAELAVRSESGIFRQGKQCRERWINHLDPSIRKGVWTEEEDAIILQGVLELGKKWAEISKRLEGRTENSIKNRWISLIKRNKSEFKVEGVNSADEREEDEEWEKKIAQNILNANKSKEKASKGQQLAAIREKLRQTKPENNEERSQQNDKETSRISEQNKFSCNSQKRNKTPEVQHQNDFSKPHSKEKYSKEAQSKQQRQVDLTKNFEGGEYIKSRRSVAANSQHFNPLQTQILSVPPIMPKRSSLSIPSQNIYSLSQPEHYYPPQPQPDFYYREEPFTEPNRHFGYDRRYLTSGHNQGMMMMAEPMSNRGRGPEHQVHNQFNDFQQHETAFVYNHEDNHKNHVEREMTALSARNNSQNYVQHQELQDERDEDQDHHYLLTERSLGDGKQLEKDLDHPAAPLYFAVVNVLTKEIFFVDAATKRNYEKTLRTIKDEECDDFSYENGSYQSKNKF